MSISILNRGASGGLKPELTVIAPSGSTIDLLQNGIIVATYTLGASETEHTFVVKVGTYTVRGTPETNNKTAEVVIDTVGVYEVDITKFSLYTDFSAKGEDWTETGGSPNYGNGVYVNAGSSKGTFSGPGTNLSRRLEIPVMLQEKFFVEYADVVTSTANNQMGYTSVRLVDDNGIEVYYVDRGDGWAGTTNQVVNTSGGTVLTEASGYSGVSITHRIEYSDGVFNYYMNGVFKKSFSMDVDEITAIRIYLSGAYETQYPQAGVKVAYLDVGEQ